MGILKGEFEILMKRLFLAAIAVLAISQPVLSESQFDDQLEDARKDALSPHFSQKE